MKHRNYATVVFVITMAVGAHLCAQTSTPSTRPAPAATAVPDPFLAQYPKCDSAGSHAECLSALRVGCVAKNADACHHYSLELAKDCPPIPAFTIPQDPAAQAAANATAAKIMMCAMKTSCWEARSQIIPRMNNACATNSSSDACRIEMQNLQSYSVLACDSRGNAPAAPSGLH